MHSAPVDIGRRMGVSMRRCSHLDAACAVQSAAMDIGRRMGVSIRRCGICDQELADNATHTLGAAQQGGGQGQPGSSTASVQVRPPVAATGPVRARRGLELAQLLNASSCAALHSWRASMQSTSSVKREHGRPTRCAVLHSWRASTCSTTSAYEAGRSSARRTPAQPAWRRWTCAPSWPTGPGRRATSPGALRGVLRVCLLDLARKRSGTHLQQLLLPGEGRHARNPRRPALGDARHLLVRFGGSCALVL